ncbi:MAG: Carboxymuconolactone decarboxylase family protein [Methanomassiliicoccales archaeon PtaU1.Bin124]|nr:MAG: Carboxymuconolactone decarboxylase family protein [Methanomassiliicoccales archaeon PtaU1.Bin124]
MKSCPKMGADEAVAKLHKEMGGYTPQTLNHIKQHHPQLATTIHEMDRIVVEDGALDRKTKRLIALACVAVRMCEGCIYPQAKVAKNYGATREEILEALNVAVLVGGVPSWSTCKSGISELFAEWDEEDAKKAKKPAPAKKPRAKKV